MYTNKIGGALMKKVLLYCICLFLVLHWSHADTAPKNTFKIYYGNITQVELEKLAKFDVIIIEALQLEAGQVDYLHQHGVIIYGYLSMMEVGRWDDQLISLIPLDAYLSIDGINQVENENRLGDLRETDFRIALQKTLQSRIVDQDLDGVFFDTAGTIDHYKKNEKLHQELLKGYEDLLKTVSITYPDLLIGQNRGFKLLEEPIATRIDLLLWEDFKSPKGNGPLRYQERIDDLVLLLDLQILTVSYDGHEANKKTAEDLGWWHYEHLRGLSHYNW
jgi:hypothetical protein